MPFVVFATILSERTGAPLKLFLSSSFISCIISAFPRWEEKSYGCRCPNFLPFLLSCRKISEVEREIICKGRLRRVAHTACRTQEDVTHGFHHLFAAPLVFRLKRGLLECSTTMRRPFSTMSSRTSAARPVGGGKASARSYSGTCIPGKSRRLGMPFARPAAKPSATTAPAAAHALPGSSGSGYHEGGSPAFLLN